MFEVTNKDYKLIADIIIELKNKKIDFTDYGIHVVVEFFIDKLKLKNDKFDAIKFRDYCNKKFTKSMFGG